MSGYDRNAGKSNNAVEAEQNGLVVASVLAKLVKCDLTAVKTYCEPSEWHHTSKAYNRVNYYSTAVLEDAETLAKMREMTKRNRQAKKAKGEIGHDDCEVAWIEWSGSLRKPKAEERSASACRVVVKGNTASVFSERGVPFLTKRLTTRGFSFTSAADKERRAIESRERAIEHDRIAAEMLARVTSALNGRAIIREEVGSGRVARISIDYRYGVLLKHIEQIEAGADEIEYGYYNKRILRFVRPDKDGIAAGFDAEGFDASGFDAEGKDREGYDRDGFSQTGRDRAGFGKDNLDVEGYNREGFDKRGFDRNETHRLTKTKYNRAGRDKAGLTAEERAKRLCSCGQEFKIYGGKCFSCASRCECGNTKDYSKELCTPCRKAKLRVRQGLTPEELRWIDWTDAGFSIEEAKRLRATGVKLFEAIRKTLQIDSAPVSA
jgi:hypothetical protein